VTATSRPKAAILIAQRIVRDIISAGMKTGELLPPERVMLENYAAGRGTLREALRLLEFQGVISLKPGPGGGPVLLSPAATNLAGSMMLFMQLNHAPFRASVEVRSAFEPMISQFAAQRMSDDQLGELGDTIKSMRADLDDRDQFLESSKRFHSIIAWSSGNVLFGYLIDSLLDILEGTVTDVGYASQHGAAVLKAHEEIYEALAERDAQASEHRMSEHLDAYVQYARTRIPDVLDQTVTWDHLLANSA
jgi:GntR family transcriptional regulator, transcriptional repressor for pyruvate dehydrogenase complex